MTEQQRMWQLGARFGAIGIEMATTLIVLALVMGWLLPDHHGVLIGFAMGLINACLVLRRAARSYRALVMEEGQVEALADAKSERATGAKDRR